MSKYIATERKKMKKRILIFIAIISCVFVCVSCSEKSSKKESKTDNHTTETVSSHNEVTGEMNQYMEAINEYFKNNDDWGHSDWILISFPVIYYVDKSDETDIKVYGNFLIGRYTVYEKQMINQSGGENPGVCHIRKEGSNYSMVSFEASEDGAYLRESILDFESKINSTLNPTFSEWYFDNSIKENVIKSVENVVLYKYAVENGLDCSAYMDYEHNIISIPKIKKVKYNNNIYTDTGQILYYLSDEKDNFQIENVVNDADNCSDANASDFDKCTIRTDMGDNQIGVKIHGNWHVFER